MSGVVTASLLPDPPRRGQDEFLLQKQVVQFLRWALPLDAVYYSVPNEGLRSRKALAKLVGMGLRPGMPDIGLCHQGRAVFIELKTPRGALSQVQRQMHRRLTLAGATVLICRSLEGVENSLRELGVPLRASVS